MNDAERISAAGGLIDIGEDAFGLADGSVLNWRGVNYTPQRASLRVKFHNWRVRTIDAWRSRRGRIQDVTA